MTLSIRKVTSADRASVVGIIGRCPNINEEEKHCAVELLDIYLNEAGQKDYLFVAAEGLNGLEGYVCYGPTPLTASTFDLYWIIVDGGCQGRGVGRALLERVEGEISTSPGAMIVAETSGTGPYEPTRRFYAGCGFIREAVIKDYYRQGDDLVVYVKRIELMPR